MHVWYSSVRSRQAARSTTHATGNRRQRRTQAMHTSEHQNRTSNAKCGNNTLTCRSDRVPCAPGWSARRRRSGGRCRQPGSTKSKVRIVQTRTQQQQSTSRRNHRSQRLSERHRTDTRGNQAGGTGMHSAWQQLETDGQARKNAT